VKVHHTALCPGDLDASIRFYTEGLGFEPIFDVEFDGDWPTLFGAPSDSLRSVFLGDPNDPDGGILELVRFAGTATNDRQPTPHGPPAVGFFLISLYCALDDTLARLAAIGVTAESRISVHGVGMAVVRDPDGTRVELIDAAAVQPVAGAGSTA
jgi:glyoxylase I family protein